MLMVGAQYPGKRSVNACWILVHRLRRWTNIQPALGERLVFDGS